jgi:hypothetical protein
MEKEETVEIIITALRDKNALTDYCKIQNGKAVRVEMRDGTYF